jgi:hypothetical protein
MSFFSSPNVTDIFTPIGSTYTDIFTPIGSTYTDVYTPISTSSVFLSDPFITTDVWPLSPVMSPYSVPLTLSFDYSKPLVGVYETIDNNPGVRSKMIKYYYDLIRDQWLLDELNDILNYFTFSDGKVKMIPNLSAYSSQNIAKDTDKIAEKKVEYIEDTILTKYDMTEILNKFSKEMRIKWVDLPKHEFLLRQAAKEYLLKEIRRKLKKQE